MFKQKREKFHLLQKIANREFSGSFHPSRALHTRHGKAHELFKDIPSRCTYQLSELIQLGRHVFMGTTRCGRFLITYSYLTSPSLLSPSHEYRLHWWLYHPFKQATKVAEVKLFSDQAINNIITIGIAQWPKVNNRLIVYGYSAGSDEDHMVTSSSASDLDQRRYYFTITTLPSSNNCRDCKKIASSFNEEDMAANWDTCVGLSCLKHGLTVHASFDVLYPFPSFHSCINLKLDDRIIFNSGNFLHVIFVEMENDYLGLKSSQPKDNITPDRINHKIGKSLFFNFPKEYLLPLNLAQAYQIHQTISLYQQQQSVERATKRWCNRIPNLAMKPVPVKTKAWRRTITDQAEKVYAFEEAEDGCEPKFKWYRRRRLADKMYEFCSDEEDMENIQPESKLPRYKFSSLSPEKNKMTTNNFGDKSENAHPMSPLKMESISQPFTKMMINNSNKTRLIERSHREIKTDYDMVGLQTTVEVTDGLSQNTIPDLCSQKMNDGKQKVEDSSSVVNSQPCSDNVGNVSVNSNLRGMSVNSDSSSVDTSINLSRTLANRSDTMQQLSIKTDGDNKDLEMVCDNSVNSISNLFMTSSKAETVLDIIKEWEVDSVSSLSPKSCSNLWVPNPIDMKRHDAIQRFLEIPQRVDVLMKNNARSGTNSTNRKRLFDWLSSNHPNKKITLAQNLLKPYGSSDTGLEESQTSKPDLVESSNDVHSKSCSKIKVVLRPCNRNKHNTTSNNNVSGSCTKQPMAIEQCSDEEKSCASPVKEDIKPKSFNKAIKEQLTEAFSHHMLQDCTVQLDRRYIEVDEELISTITDIEDDDQSSIGFHCALPIVVHGSAYSQLQMVSNSKVDKLNMPSVFVRQSSLDFEPLCHQSANIISECEGYKFWSLNDYETEIINICPINCDILFLVHMRLNVEPRYERMNGLSKLPNDKRDFYECRCIFIWNPESNECRLEAYTKFTNAVANNLSLINHNHLNSLTLAQREALKLRKTSSIGLFGYDLNLPVRNLDHQLFDDEYNIVETVHEIRDQTNLMVITLDNPELEENSLRRHVVELM